MLITKELIKSLNPCADRYDNYLKHYGHLSLTKAQFMGRKNISQSDKLWVAFRLMPEKNIALAAADIAESVLHLYEAEYPNDNRPRKAITAARLGKGDLIYLDGSSHNDTHLGYVIYAAYYSLKVSNNTSSAPDASAQYATYAAFAAASCYSAASFYGNKYTFEDALKQEKLTRKIILKYWR